MRRGGTVRLSIVSTRSQLMAKSIRLLNKILPSRPFLCNFAYASAHTPKTWKLPRGHNRDREHFLMLIWELFLNYLPRSSHGRASFIYLHLPCSCRDLVVGIVDQLIMMLLPHAKFIEDTRPNGKNVSISSRRISVHHGQSFFCLFMALPWLAKTNKQLPYSVTERRSTWKIS